MENARNPRYVRRQSLRVPSVTPESMSRNTTQGGARDVNPNPAPRVAPRQVITDSQKAWQTTQREALFSKQFPTVYRMCRNGKLDKKAMACTIRGNKKIGDQWYDDCLCMMDITYRVLGDNSDKLRTIWGRYFCDADMPSIKEEASIAELVDIGILGLAALMDWPIQKTSKEEFAFLQQELTGIPRMGSPDDQVAQDRKQSPDKEMLEIPETREVDPQQTEAEVRPLIGVQEDQVSIEERTNSALKKWWKQS